MRPSGVPTVGFDERAEVENLLTAGTGPAHAAAAEANIDERLASGFDRAAADRQRP